jgi:GT2 family glycosyltransferase
MSASKPKISILLAAYKSEGLLRKVFCRSYFENCLSNPDIDLVIYDNGGNGKELDVLRQDPNYEIDTEQVLGIKVVGNGTNIGLNAALNECAKVATGDYFYLPHTDMYLMPGWDTALLEACKNLPPASFLLCSRSIEPTKGHTEYHIIKDYGKEWNEFQEEKLLEEFQGYRDRTITTGYRMPFFMHRSLWDKMGGVDAHYFSYCTDDDLVQTAYDKGVRRFWMVNDSLVYHLQGKSNAQQKVDKDRNEPYEYFVNKWKSKYPDATHPGHWHPKLIPWYVKVR